jgi:hypothetical protein
MYGGKQGAMSRTVGKHGMKGAAFHIAIGMLVLLVCLCSPRPGSAVLLVSLWPGHHGPGVDDGMPTGMALLGRGRFLGALVVRPQGDVPVWALLRHGILPLAVPVTLCGQSQ